MLRKLITSALILAPLAASANTGWDYEWEMLTGPWQVDAMDWTLEVKPDMTEAEVKQLLPPPSHPDYCVGPVCSDADRMDEFVFKLFKDNPPANLPDYPLGCSGSECTWTW